MNEITIGAVGAAIIAGLVSLLGLIIGKEQKISEFRQAWIDELRKLIGSYLVHINAVSDSIRLRKAGEEIKASDLVANYKSLNEASNGIILRVNDSEPTTKRLIDAMKSFEKLAEKSDELTPDNIKVSETEFIAASKALLKFEWQRVKKGETAFVVTKYVVGLVIVLLVVILFLASINNNSNKSERRDPFIIPAINTMS